MGCGQSEEKRAEKGGLREDPIFTIFASLGFHKACPSPSFEHVIIGYLSFPLFQIQEIRIEHPHLPLAPFIWFHQKCHLYALSPNSNTLLSL